MSEKEEILLQRMKELEELQLESNNSDEIPSYKYRKLRDIDLEKLFNIEKKLTRDIFKPWLNNGIKIDKECDLFLKELIEDNETLIETYSEEDLKINFIAPLLKKVRFKSYEHNIRDFYELKLTYKTETFILNGTTDFVVSKGLVKSKKPYFFIQEFKRNEDYSNPRPQLLGELISAIELNHWKTIKGAYIIGGNWHFVILEKLEKDSYQYYTSRNYDSTNINDMREIYRNLVFVRDEIFGGDNNN